ncbi:hypothetical protein ILUMI_08367 [Ignelater luminosus]|uniref:RRM domain-containing protein n=1 Tax=Ignelater luminosus TaxID=2038154 RepID=A0A8K0GG06_IGNLU|nr:hypothetical protein ILUMI_08367 [Ignelater luminosus]
MYLATSTSFKTFSLFLNLTSTACFISECLHSTLQYNFSAIMSRLIVKNLPKKITETRIREIFSAKGSVTDIQLKYTPEGKFRQFAFIGYHNEDEANEAIKTFNNSHISTNKITVEPCSLLGDTKKPKSWSKYAADSTAYKQSHPDLIQQEIKEKPEKKKKKNKEIELLEKYKNDPQFEEFLQLHSSKDAQKLLSNIEADKDSEDKEEESGDDETEEAQDDTSKLANQDISDAEYMKSLMKKSDASDKESGTSKEQKSENDLKSKVELFTVKLRNLPYTCKKKDIKDFFRPVAPYSIRIPRNIKGIAYAGFKTEKKFKQALLKDRSFMGGKRISVAKYTNKDDNNQEKEIDPKKTKWKTQEESLKHEEDIAESGRIFIRNLSYTTTEDDIQELFSKYGPLTEVSLPVDFTTRKLKGFGVITFLMPEHAVKAYSELDGSIVHGRMLHLLPGKAKDTPEDDQNTTNYKQKKALKQKTQAGLSHNWNSLFLGHDAVADVIAKQYGTSKENVLNPHGDGSAAVRLALGETQIVANTRKFLEQEGVYLDAFSDSGAKRSKTIILVKNLPAETEPREIRELFEKHGVLNRVIFPPSGITVLHKHFEVCGKINYATVATKKDKNDPKSRLSMGYGFVRFYHKASADKALKTLQCSTLDGKTLELKRSERTLQNEVKSTRKSSKSTKQTGTKILVRNVPFQANQKEIMELFRTFGEIKALRLPKKLSGGENAHRGFAFVDFFTTSDAKKAFEALSQSTHLYGRRLVLEWASTNEGVDQIRKRTAEHFHTEKEVRSKRSVLDIEKL